ncbi:Multidrug resistance protein [Diaporthe australafricana]|uniref:Multidrug resistance protein n=1 Tax=Diaporthe australafricana TaxID=127596 RepID=A0ABR3VV97_9PEZI
MEHPQASDVEKCNQDTFIHDVNVISSKRIDARHQEQEEASSVLDAVRAQSAIFHWKDLGYEIKDHQGKILNNINGWVKPGTLMALMGVTGAGKTSLLDVLSNRITSGSVTGEVYVDGTVRDAGFSRRIGYVQQDDIHLPTASVREALHFSALLRQPRHRTAEEKLAYVDNVIIMLEMEQYADAIIGVPGEGLNVEQRRRLSIAVEMAANPELLLFLELFQMFDSLLLLGSGGSELYFGPIGSDAMDLIHYFETQGAPKCPTGANPADWVIEATRDTGGLEEGKESWSRKWDVSERKKEVLQHLTSLDKNLTPGGKADKYAASTLRQLVIVTQRIFQDYWRDPKYLYSKIALCFGISLANGISFYNSPLDIQGLTNSLFSTFLITQLFSSIGQQIIPRLVSGRSLFEARERHNMSYSWVVFIASNIVVELFWQTIVSVLVFTSWYFPTGMWRNGDAAFTTAQRGGAIFVLIWLFCLWNSTLAQALAAGIEHAETAVQLSTLCFWLSLVFCGILVPPKALPGFWIFMYRVSPQTYLMNGLATAGLSNTKVICSSTESVHIDILPTGRSSCGEYLEAYAEAAKGYVMNPNATSNCQYCPVSETNDLLGTFEMAKDNVWRNVGLVAVYVAFNIFITFGFYKLARVPKHEKK